jgi:hypothetical protein
MSISTRSFKKIGSRQGLGGFFDFVGCISIHGTLRLCRMNNAGKMTVDKPKRMGFLIASIPAKPLAQAKLKCGGFFIAAIAPGRLA